MPPISKIKTFGIKKNKTNTPTTPFNLKTPTNKTPHYSRKSNNINNKESESKSKYNTSQNNLIENYKNHKRYKYQVKILQILQFIKALKKSNKENRYIYQSLKKHIDFEYKHQQTQT